MKRIAWPTLVLFILVIFLFGIHARNKERERLHSKTTAVALAEVADDGKSYLKLPYTQTGDRWIVETNSPEVGGLWKLSLVLPSAGIHIIAFSGQHIEVGSQAFVTELTYRWVKTGNPTFFHIAELAEIPDKITAYGKTYQLVNTNR